MRDMQEVRSKKRRTHGMQALHRLFRWKLYGTRTDKHDSMQKMEAQCEVHAFEEWEAHVIPKNHRRTHEDCEFRVLCEKTRNYTLEGKRSVLEEILK